MLAWRASGILECVILTSSDAALAALLVSPLLLAQAWPGVCEEVKTLIHVLRMALATLADALDIGLVDVVAPRMAVPAGQISLTCGSAMLTAVAKDETGEVICDPQDHPALVRRLEIISLTAGGRSGLGLAG